MCMLKLQHRVCVQDEEECHSEGHTASDAPSAPTSLLRKGLTGDDTPLAVHRRTHPQPSPETLNHHWRGTSTELSDRPRSPPRELPIARLSSRADPAEGHQPMRRSRSKQAGLGVPTGVGATIPISVKATAFGSHHLPSDLPGLKPTIGLVTKPGS